MTASEESHIGEKPQADYEHSRVLLTGGEALARARASPNDALPIALTYSFDDKENPRNWPKWRKWYITFLVSMLNVVTYVQVFSPFDSLLVPCLIHSQLLVRRWHLVRNDPDCLRVRGLFRGDYFMPVYVCPRICNRPRSTRAAFRILRPPTHLRGVVVPPLRFPNAHRPRT